jgi:hypothetical protein
MRSKRLGAEGSLRFSWDATSQPKAQFHDQFRFFSTGDGVFMVSGNIISRRSQFRSGML